MATSAEAGARAGAGIRAVARGGVGVETEAETVAAAAAAASAFRHCDTMKEALKNMPAKGRRGGITMHVCAGVCV